MMRLLMCPSMLLVLLQLLHVSVDGGDGRDVHDVAYRALEIGEMDRFVQSHLDRTDDLGLGTQALQELVAAVGRGEVGEDERVDFLPFQPCERVLLVAQLSVECEVHLHLAVDGQIRTLAL